MRSAYIWASAFWQISVLAGGATLTHISGNGWWIVGAVILKILGAQGLSDRLDRWQEGQGAQSPVGPVSPKK